jgi:hypothetical protein
MPSRQYAGGEWVIGAALWNCAKLLIMPSGQ